MVHYILVCLLNSVIITPENVYECADIHHIYTLRCRRMNIIYFTYDRIQFRQRNEVKLVKISPIQVLYTFRDDVTLRPRVDRLWRTTIRFFSFLVDIEFGIIEMLW